MLKRVVALIDTARYEKSLGVRIETVEKILNHASGSFRGIVAVYQKYDFALSKAA
jgi:hypothetical protein